MLTVLNRIESKRTLAYCMTHTPLIELAFPRTIEERQFFPSKPHNYSTAKYAGAQGMYDALDLLRVPKDGQRPDKLRRAVSQHWLPCFAKVPVGVGCTTPFTLPNFGTAEELHRALLSMSPALVRANGCFDPDGVRLSKVWVVRISAVKSRAVELDMASPPTADNPAGGLPSERQHRAMCRAVYNAFQPRDAATNPWGGIFPAHVLRPGLVLWLLNVSELPSLPTGADGRTLMHRVAVTLPAPAALQAEGHHVVQAFTRPLGFQTSVSETDWDAFLREKYSPGPGDVPLQDLHAYSAAAAAVNINSVAPGAVSPAAIVAHSAPAAAQVDPVRGEQAGFVAGGASGHGLPPLSLGLAPTSGGASPRRRSTSRRAALRGSVSPSSSVGGSKRSRDGSTSSSVESLSALQWGGATAEGMCAQLSPGTPDSSEDFAAAGAGGSGCSDGECSSSVSTVVCPSPVDDAAFLSCASPCKRPRSGSVDSADEPLVAVPVTAYMPTMGMGLAAQPAAAALGSPMGLLAQAEPALPPASVGGNDFDSVDGTDLDSASVDGTDFDSIFSAFLLPAQDVVDDDTRSFMSRDLGSSPLA